MSKEQELAYLREVVRLLESRHNDTVKLELLRAKNVAAKSVGS